ncbi:TIGR02450 family Trp-rich protein [Ferrimonas aestuarii]|uniref:TIGR02450 family Trp-rich protein n=1 Tax=Ferrimonas aestuarii TaxID=2569539 RepID=A0A4U1BLX9_9GAMM|nr:TIGR02450 family Trp-rich protein [Ferrimonas aestuarii]TKB54322.1 TIGR02450 family Trp-rich protein [Ferrimonas aestuarii]
MNIFSEKHLHLSKWTANTAVNDDTHFWITYTFTDGHGHVTRVGMQGVNNRTPLEINADELTDSGRWHMGWI